MDVFTFDFGCLVSYQTAFKTHEMLSYFRFVTHQVSNFM